MESSRALAALLLAIRLVMARADLLANSTLPELQCDGSEAPGDSCWVAASTFPRQCNCVRNACPSASISETTTCFMCDRGAILGRRSAAGGLVHLQPTSAAAAAAAMQGRFPAAPSPSSSPISLPALRPSDRVWHLRQRGRVHGRRSRGAGGGHRPLHLPRPKLPTDRLPRALACDRRCEWLFGDRSAVMLS